MPAQVLGGAVHHDVGPELEGVQQVGAGQGIVHDEGDACFVGDGGDGLEVGDIQLGVAHGLDVDGAGLGPQGGAEGLGLGRIHEGGGDARPRQGVAQQVVGAAVEVVPGHHMVAAAQQGGEGKRDGRLARGRGQGPDAALQLGHALLQHGRGGVHDPGVDVSRHFQVEEGRAVLRAVEHVAGGLVDGYGAALRIRIRRVAPVEGDGLEVGGGFWGGGGAHGVSWRRKVEKAEASSVQASPGKAKGGPMSRAPFDDCVSSTQLDISPRLIAQSRQELAPCFRRLPRFHRARPSTFLDNSLWN